MNKNKFSIWFPFAIVLFEIATYLGNDMYLPGLPSLMQTLKVSQETAQNTLLYWFLGSASMQLLIGPLSDRFGRKIVLVIGALLFTVASFLCVHTTNITWFFVLRFIQGSMVCVVVVAGYSAIHEYFESKIAIKIVSLMGSVSILAPAFGPMLGALVIEIASWQMIFMVLATWGLVSAILLGFFVPQTQKEPIALSIPSIIKNYIKIATHKTFLKYTLSFCFLFLSLICWVVESPFLLMDVYHQSVIGYGFIQLCIFGSFIIGAQITALLINRVRPYMLIKIAFSIALVGALGFIALSILAVPLYFQMLSMMVYGLGTAMGSGPLSRFAIEACQEPMGSKMAVFSSYMSFFGVLGITLVRVFHTDSMQFLALIVAVGAMAGAFIFSLTTVKAYTSNS